MARQNSEIGTHNGQWGMFGGFGLDDIWTFVHVVETGSFAQAGTRLGVTRSAVAKAVARLEQRLQVRLLQRTTRQQTLTDDGQLYYEHCVRALQELSTAEATFDESRRHPQGRLRVTAPVVYGRHCIAPILVELAQRHPALEIEMALTDRSINMMEERFDLAIRIGALPDTPHLVARKLGQQRMGICGAPTYLRKHGRPQSVQDLHQHQAVVYGRNGQKRSWILWDDTGTKQEIQLRSRCYFDDLQAILDAAIAGLGLAWLPCWLIAPALQTGQLELLLDASAMPSADVHALWPHSQHLPSRTRAAIKALLAGVASRMGVLDTPT